MEFGGDEFVSGCLALDFVNTVGGDRRSAFKEKLENFEDVLEWLEASGTCPGRVAAQLRSLAQKKPADARRAFDATLEARETLYRVFEARRCGHAIAKGDLGQLNDILARSGQHLCLRNIRGDISWRWDDEVELERPLYLVARSAAELLVSQRSDRLRRCEGEDCGWLFLDLSKNRSRRWCNMSGCGNRAKVKRYRSRN